MNQNNDEKKRKQSLGERNHGMESRQAVGSHELSHSLWKLRRPPAWGRNPNAGFGKVNHKCGCTPTVRLFQRTSRTQPVRNNSIRMRKREHGDSETAGQHIMNGGQGPDNLRTTHPMHVYRRFSACSEPPEQKVRGVQLSALLSDAPKERGVNSRRSLPSAIAHLGVAGKTADARGVRLSKCWQAREVDTRSSKAVLNAFCARRFWYHRAIPGPKVGGVLVHDWEGRDRLICDNYHPAVGKVLELDRSAFNEVVRFDMAEKRLLDRSGGVGSIGLIGVRVHHPGTVVHPQNHVKWLNISCQPFIKGQVGFLEPGADLTEHLFLVVVIKVVEPADSGFVLVEPSFSGQGCSCVDVVREYSVSG
jgi:hypothetical protein